MAPRFGLYSSEENYKIEAREIIITLTQLYSKQEIAIKEYVQVNPCQFAILFSAKYKLGNIFLWIRFNTISSEVNQFRLGLSPSRDTELSAKTVIQIMLPKQSFKRLATYFQLKTGNQLDAQRKYPTTLISVHHVFLVHLKLRHIERIQTSAKYVHFS